MRISNDRLKIAFICDDLMTGGWTSLVDLALELKKNDIWVNFYTLFGNGANANVLMRNGINVECLFMSKINFPWKLLVLAQKLRHNSFDIVHTNLLYSDIFGLCAAKFAKIPIRISQIHSIGSGFSGWINTARKYLLWETGLILCVSNSASANFAKEYSGFENKTRVLYNGINLEAFRKRFNNSKISREEFLIPDDAFVFLMAGNFKKEKGHAKLVLASRFLLNENIVFLIAGHGEEKSYVEELVINNGLGRIFRFLGLRDDIPELMKIADACIMPSTDEAFGIFALEAFAVGRPLIAAYAGGLMETAENGIDAILVSDPEPVSIAGAIRQLISDAGLRSRLATASIKKSEKYDIKITAKKYLKLIDAINNSQDADL